jgi:hypothetical protein
VLNGVGRPIPVAPYSSSAVLSLPAAAAASCSAGADNRAAGARRPAESFDVWGMMVGTRCLKKTAEITPRLTVLPRA